MKIEVSPLLAAVAAGVLALVTAVITAWLTRRREDRTAEREAKKERVTEVKDLYQEAVTVLNIHLQNEGLGDQAFGDRLYAIQARMALSENRKVAALFLEVAQLIDQWAYCRRNGSPQKMGGMLVFTSSPAAKANNEKAEQFHPRIFEKLSELQTCMSEEIQRVQAK